MTLHVCHEVALGKFQAYHAKGMHQILFLSQKKPALSWLLQILANSTN